MNDFKAGNFFVLGFDGANNVGHLGALNQKYGLGGAILFNRNVQEPGQVRHLTHELKKMAGRDDFIICIDQEGGRFQKLQPPHFTQYPPANEVSKEKAYEIARRMGRELHDLGFNMCNGPVLDVNTNPKNPIINVRSFANDPRRVAEIGKEFIRGLQDSGVMACGKHFPGHGDTDQDSHVTLPIVKHGVERLDKIELLPFRELMASGMQMIMSAHVVFPALDPSPATFSRRIMNDLLRRDLNYHGLVITDDMGMAGAKIFGDLPEACVKAFAAGCDLILLCEHHDRHEEVLRYFQDAVAASPVLRRRCDESATRIKLNAWKH